MLIEHKKLFVPWLHGGSWKQMFEYSKQAEAALASLVFPNAEINLSEGKNSEYDFSIGNDRYEVKFQNTSGVSLELRQEKTGDPSGILTSNSNYWLIVSRSLTNTGEQVGKIRRYLLWDLLESALRSLTGSTADFSDYSNEELKEQILKTNSQEKKLMFNPRNLNHYWLGDICVEDNERGCVWDISRWKRKSY